MCADDSRVGQLNAVIDEKLLFFAKLAARHAGMSIVEFTEYAYTLAVSSAFKEQEPSVTEPDPAVIPSSILQIPSWVQSLWVDTGNPKKDAMVRLFNVGMQDLNLLTPKQRTLFHNVLTELAKQRKKPSPKTFAEIAEGLE